MSWTDNAAAVIRKVLAETKDLPSPERIKRVDAAYPFGQRAYWPYKAWLKARRELLVGAGLMQRPAVKGWDPQQQPTPRTAPLYDPSLGPPAPIEAAP